MEDKNMKISRLLLVVQAVSLSLCFIATPVDATSGIEQVSSNENRYGAHIDRDGWVHFVVFSPYANKVNLLLFDSAEATTPNHIIPLEKQRTDWRIKIKGP
jgi:1,4-alpha-glucan branching enzyme